MTTQETWADKISKLLLKAESTTAEEAEALYAKAQELMTKYSIDEAMLAAARDLKSDNPIVKEEFALVGIYRYALFNLSVHALRTNSLEVIELMDPGWREVDGRVFKEVKVLIGVGYKSDVGRARILQTSLLLQAMTAENQWWQEHKNLYENNKRGGHYERRQFLFSFANGVGEKLTQAKQKGREAADEEHGSESVALVLRDKSLAIRDEFEKMFPETRSTRSRYAAGDRFAAEKGLEAGRRADVGQPGVGGNRKQLDS